MIHAQPLPAGLHSTLSLFNMVMQDGFPDDEPAAAEPSYGYDGSITGHMNQNPVMCRVQAVSRASECTFSGRQLSRPRRWGINE